MNEPEVELCEFRKQFSSNSVLHHLHDANWKHFMVHAGSGLEMKNWLRISIAVDPPLLEDGLERVKPFCLRHVKPIIMNQAS